MDGFTSNAVHHPSFFLLTSGSVGSVGSVAELKFYKEVILVFK
jgi:hypothetical protein